MTENDTVQNRSYQGSTHYNDQACRECGSEFNVTMLEPPEGGMFARDFCPNCGEALR